VKTVRAAWSNLIGLNTVTDNNEGASERFHFFGIELGAAKADAPSAEFDFAPSRANRSRLTEFDAHWTFEPVPLR